MNVISVVIGIGALVIALVGFVPLLGWLNWIALALCSVGFLMGVLSKNNGGKYLNAFVAVIALFRLFMGGGIL